MSKLISVLCPSDFVWIIPDWIMIKFLGSKSRISNWYETVSRFFSHCITEGFPVGPECRRQVKLQSNFTAHRSRVCRRSCLMIPEDQYSDMVKTDVSRRSSCWSRCLCEYRECTGSSLCPDVTGVTRLTRCHRRFHAAEEWNGFALTNDLTSRTTRTVDLHLSKCLLTTCLSFLESHSD